MDKDIEIPGGFLAAQVGDICTKEDFRYGRSIGTDCPSHISDKIKSSYYLRIHAVKE